MRCKKKIVFFVRCRPQDADLSKIVRDYKRVFIGYPMWLTKEEDNRGTSALKEQIADLDCTDSEWENYLKKAPKAENGKQYTQNRNLVKRVDEGSIVLVPRPSEGLVLAGRVGKFELLDDPPWAEEYLEIRKQRNLEREHRSHIADVAQCWPIDNVRELPFSSIPAWIRRSFFGRSTYGEIHSLELAGETLNPFEKLNKIICAFDSKEPGQTWGWTTDENEIEMRLVTAIGPSTFEHLCVALLQLENPNERWEHVGGSGDGGVDGIGTDEQGVCGILQCKWQCSSAPEKGEEAKIRHWLSSLLHSENINPMGWDFLSRKKIAQLVVKHAEKLPIAISLRIGQNRQGG